MKRLPSDVLKQVNQIRTALESGQHWSQVGGRRHVHSDRIVFRLKHWYRLVCWHPCHPFQKLEVMTHEHYNGIIRKSRR